MMLERLRRRLAGLLKRRAPVGRLEAIFITDAGGQPMRQVQQVDAIAGRGLDGDRYAAGSGFWRATDGCQVTLIHAEDLRRAERRFRIPLTDGRHRRNLVVSGLHRLALRGRRLRIGGALLAWQRVRPPCGYLDKIEGRGTAKALGKRAGVCLTVIEGGPMRVGDPVRVEPRH